MSGFDDLRRELAAGVERQAAPARPSRMRRRARNIPLVAIVATLGLGGVAFAAVQLLERGDPVPESPTRDWLRDLGSTDRRVLPMRIPDPAGGLPWGLSVFRSKVPARNGFVVCAMFGRAQGNEIGVIGRDDTFGNDGRFHPLSPTSSQSGSCGGASKEGHLLMGGSARMIPASGYLGDPDARSKGTPIAGCSTPGEKPTARQSTCPADSMRLLKYGFGGPEAVQVTYANRRIALQQHPAPGTSGAYLFVQRPADTRAGGQMMLTITYRDGTVCREFNPAARTRDMREAFLQHRRANPGCQPPPGF